MKFLKKNWIWILVVIVTCGVISGVISVNALLKDNKQYKAKIKTLDVDIAQKEKRIEVIKKENVVLKDERKKDKAIIAADKKKMRKDEKVIAMIRVKMGELEERVKDLPISIVVIETRLAINTKEVWKRPEGVLFSLKASQTNLAILQGFSLLKDDRDKLQVNYDRAKDALERAEGTLAIDEEIFYNFDDINFSLEGIIEDKDEQFDLSEKRNRQAYWRGVKHGVPGGGFIVLLLWLVFGK